MKRKLMFCFWLLVFITTASCTLTHKLQYSVHGGINTGGITENTDMTVLPGEPADVDAFTGATRTGFHAGARAVGQLKRNQLETGIDYMLNFQTFSYNDEVNSFTGSRELEVSQLMIPLTYNIVLLQKLLPQQEIKIKLGAVGQYNMVAAEDTGTLPGYQIRPFSAGATLGFAAYPVVLGNGGKIGFYVEGYRGSRVYEDFYNQPSFEIPGSSYVKFGISYKYN